MTEHFSHPLFPDLNEARLRRIQRARGARSRFFSPGLFADPAWDMLLELYACELGQQRVNIRLLSDASAVPDTTALRWITKLEQEGLVARQEVPNNRRQVWISLTTAGTTAMARYFASLSMSPLAL